MRFLEMMNGEKLPVPNRKNCLERNRHTRHLRRLFLVLRGFLDAQNSNAPFSVEKSNLLPVDKYIGGIEHAILHLLFKIFMRALNDIYKLEVTEPFKQLFTQGMITHKTYQNSNGAWVMPKDVAIKEGKLIDINTSESVNEGPVEKMSKSKKNVVEPNEILDNYGINATRIFMISDSPPDRELEWTDEGIQSAKNLTARIERYFEKTKNEIPDETFKAVEKYVYNIEKNIKNFTFNKCVADIYTLFNYLEKNQINTGNDNLSKKILICLFPMMPSLSSKIYQNHFGKDLLKENWPIIDQSLLIEDEIKLRVKEDGELPK